jgi:DNA-directed RNA polymerase subunit RPC12/RpoP
MQSVASLEIDTARVLAERLRREGIAADPRATTEESGLDIVEIMVEDGQYERACDLAETWQEELREETERKSGRRCPKCESWHLDYQPREPVGPIWKCRDCGYEVVFKNKRI